MEGRTDTRSYRKASDLHLCRRKRRRGPFLQSHQNQRPLSESPQPRPKASSPSPGAQPHGRSLGSTSRFLQAATVVWLRRGRRGEARARSSAARSRLRRGAPGPWSPSPTPSLGGRDEGAGGTSTPEQPALGSLPPFCTSSLILGHLYPKSEEG